MTGGVPASIGNAREQFLPLSLSLFLSAEKEDGTIIRLGSQVSPPFPFSLLSLTRSRTEKERERKT